MPNGALISPTNTPRRSVLTGSQAVSIALPSHPVRAPGGTWSRSTPVCQSRSERRFDFTHEHSAEVGFDGVTGGIDRSSEPPRPRSGRHLVAEHTRVPVQIGTAL